MARGVGYTKHLDETLHKGIYETQVPNIDFLYKASTTKDPNYDIGDRVCLPDGRVFRYGKCVSSLTDMKCAVSQYNPLVMTKTAAVGAAAIGDKYLTLTVSAATWGIARDGVIAKDELKGGTIHLYNSSTVRDTRGIIGNTALASTGTSIVIYLDAGVSTALSASTYCEILANPYSALSGAAGHSVRYMGMPCALATTAQYFWIQTWGICRVSPCRGASFTANFLLSAEVVFGYNGGVMFPQEVVDDPSGEKSIGYQRAGFVVENSRLGSDTPAPFVNLQINP
jgi:hypothetical protein